MYRLNRKFEISLPPAHDMSLWCAKARTDRTSDLSSSIENDNIDKLASGVEILNWQWKGGLSDYVTIELIEEVPKLPPPPPSDPAFIQACRDLDLPLIGIEEGSIYMKEIKDLKGRSDLETTANVTRYITGLLQYQHPTKTRDINDVLTEKRSDCGGYHALFVGIMRYLGIPAVMDFGSRLPSCTPHVWAWWWDKQKGWWNMVDLNDMQRNEIVSDRVSFSLDTGISIQGFPREIIYLQHYLTWDWNYALHADLDDPVEFSMDVG